MSDKENCVVVDSLWNRCLSEIYEKAKSNNEPNIEFKDVDKLVIEKSQMPIEELKKYLMGGIH